MLTDMWWECYAERENKYKIKNTMSSENFPPTSPEQDQPATQSRAEAREAVRALLDITKLEEWRALQREQLAELRKNAPIGSNEYVKDFESTIDDNLRDFLKQHGVTEDSPFYTQAKDGYRELSLDRIHDDEWYIPPTYQYGVMSTDKVSAREKAIQVLNISSDELARSENITVHKEELERAQQAYSKKLAERSKRMGLFERPRTIAEMAEARAEIADYVGKLAAEMMDDFEAQGIDYDKRVDMVGAFIDAEMAATVEGMEAIRADDFRGRSKVMQRGLEKWASWATPTVEREENESRVHHFGRSVLKSITTLNTWKKAGAFAAVGGLAGVFTVPFVGLVGGGAVIVGGATLLARQIARGLVGAKLDSAAGAETIAKQQADEILFQMAEDSEAADTTHDDLLELAANMAEGYRKHNRNRLIGGIGISLAVGGGVGSLINNFLDLDMAFGKLNDVVRNIFGHGSQQSPVIPTTGPSGGAGSGTGSQGGMVGGEIPSDKPDIGGAHSPDVNKGEVIKDYLKEHGAARRIDGGEGWLQTFKELGMSPSERRAFLEEYGDDLLKKFPKVTYEMENGEPGILMTKDGKMPSEVLKYIVEHADKEEYIHLPTDTEVPADSVDAAQPSESIVPQEGPEQEVGNDSTGGATTIEAANKLVDTQELVPANTVSNGESLYRTFGELKKAGVIDIPANKYGQFMREVGPAIHNDAAVNKYSDGSSVVYQYRRAPYDWRFYKSPDGRLPASVIRTIERIARQGAYTKAA